jgi:putative addiction module CopG family antidote
MARAATINVSLTPSQLKLVRDRVNTGQYESASEVVREGLRRLFSTPANPSSKSLQDELARGYKASSKHDIKMTREWDAINDDTWPEK